MYFNDNINKQTTINYMLQENFNDPWCYQTDVSTTGSCRPDLEKTDCGTVA